MSNKLKTHHMQEESIWVTVRNFIGYLLDGMITVYMLLIIVVMPFYHKEGFSHIGTDKATFFRQISVLGALFLLPTVAVYLLLWVVEWAKSHERTNEWRKKISVTDLFALLYGVSLVLSYAFSDYKEKALWGADGWYMGLLPQGILLGIYFLVSRFWTRKHWSILLFLPVSAVVFVLGYLNRFGIFPIDMKLQNVQFISTIGNINWYCGYLVSVFFVGYYLLWQSKEEQLKMNFWKKMLLSLYVVTGFATLVTQGSMSGIFALAVVLLVVFCLSAGNSKRMLMFWQEVLLLSLACVGTLCVRVFGGGQITYNDTLINLLTYSAFPVIAAVISATVFLWLAYCDEHGRYPKRLFLWLKRFVTGGTVAAGCVFVGMILLNTLCPGSIGVLSDNPVFTFSPTWGSNRGATWKAGFECFAQQNVLHKIVGVGPDGMSAFLYQEGSPELLELVRESFGTSTLTNAHNEWLTILVNEGILGFVGFVGMMVSAIWRFLKSGKESAFGILAQFAGACGLCLLAYTANNMFSFQQSMSVATIFVILGMGEAYARSIRLQ